LALAADAGAHLSSQVRSIRRQPALRAWLRFECGSARSGSSMGLHKRWRSMSPRRRRSVLPIVQQSWCHPLLSPGRISSERDGTALYALTRAQPLAGKPVSTFPG